MADGEERWCVVTGGRGFAARHLVEMLIRSGKWSVRIADLAPDIQLDPSEEEGLLGDALQSGRAVYVSADLRNKAQVVTACQGAEAVFHMAAPDSSINNYQLHFSVNVAGTRNVIDACIECKVKRLIYTSSPSVVFDGIHGIYNGEESMPYPDKHNDSYSATKAEAEALVIKSNGKGGLLTCCMRPSSIFGPGDKLLVPSLVAAARAGKSKFIIGDGNNMYDFTYVENVAHAHICAEQTLASEGSSAEEAAGKAYFVTNMEPIKFWEFVSLILEGLGYERPRFKIPASVMMPIAYMVEWTFKMLAPYGMRVPQLTPSRIRLLSCNRTFNCSKAKEQLGYTPIVSLKEGLVRTVESYSSLRAEQHTKRSAGTDRPSKASTCLGNGKVADTLLWKDKKRTLTTLLVLGFVYFYFISPGYTMITAISKILLVMITFLFVHSILPAKIMGYKFEKIPASCFNFSEEKTRLIALSMGSTWNTTVGILKSLCRGNDWTLFFKVVCSLLILSFLGGVSLHSIFATETWQRRNTKIFLRALSSLSAAIPVASEHISLSLHFAFYTEMLRSATRVAFNPVGIRLLASQCSFLRFSSDAHSPTPPLPPHQDPSHQQQQESSASAAGEHKEEESSGKTHSERRGRVQSDYQTEQLRVLQAALPHVVKLGWSERALISGARDVGVSPSIVGTFARKEAALVEYFMDDCLQRLIDIIDSGVDLSNLILSGRLAKLIQTRLEMQAPYISKWPQALSIQAQPMNIPTSFKQRALLIDEIWHASGDQSTDIDWYVKRTVLGGIYSTSEVYMVTDHSPEFRDTWSFLDRRIKDAFDLQKSVQEATYLAEAVGAGMGTSLQGFMKRVFQGSS